MQSIQEFSSVYKKGTLISLVVYAIVLPISMAGTNFALVLLLFFTMLYCWAEKIKPSIPKSFWFILLFFFWAGIRGKSGGAGFNLSTFQSFSKAWNFLPYLLIPLASREIHNDIFRTVKILIVTASLVVILGAIQYWSGIHFFFEGWFGANALIINQRFWGFQSHPLHSGGLYTLVFLISLSITLFYTMKPQEKIFWFCSLAILGFGVLLTVSRSYYLALIAGSFILLAIRGWKFLLGGTLIIILLFFSLWRTNTYIHERLRTFSLTEMDESGRERIFMWKAALSMMRDHPIAGIGYRKWREKLPGYMSRFPDWKMDEEQAALAHAHNSYLTIGAETGLIGLTIFLLFWFYLIKEQIILFLSDEKRSFSSALILGTVAGIFSLMVAGFFEHNLLTATICLTLFFMIGLSRTQVDQLVE